MSRSPARNYSWPPFEKRNTAALRHGANSERSIAPLAAQIVAAAVERIPWLDVPEFGPALTAWGRAEARCALVSEWLDEHGLLDPETGAQRPAADFAVKLERLAAEARARLGLDPSSSARLQRDLGAAARDRGLMSREMAEGRRLRLAAEARSELEADE